MQFFAPKKQARKGRKAFVRTRVPLGERIAALTFVGLLAVTGGVIWIKGQHFDPNLYSLRNDALSSTSNAIEGKQGTLRESNSSNSETASPRPESASSDHNSASEAGIEGESHSESAAESPANSAANSGQPKEPLEIQLPGLKPMSPTEYYSAENLFEKIDGRAPAYLAFGFQQLRTRSFSLEGSAASYVDVYEFRMDTPVNAFGAFAMERDPKGNRLEFAPDGYAGALGFYFRQGTVYVQVIASDQNPKTLEMAKAIAENRAKAIPANNDGLDARRKLPSAGLLPSSVTFIQDNAQGQEFLKNVFQAVYQFEGKELPFFIMSTDQKNALDSWTAYRQFCGKFGGKTSALPDIEGAKLFKAENFGTWKVIYQRGGEIGGVFDAPEAEKAQKFIEQYLKGEIQ